MPMRLHLFVKLKYQLYTKIMSVGIKYSVRIKPSVRQEFFINFQYNRPTPRAQEYYKFLLNILCVT